VSLRDPRLVLALSLLVGSVMAFLSYWIGPSAVRIVRGMPVTYSTVVAEGSVAVSTVAPVRPHGAKISSAKEKSPVDKKLTFKDSPLLTQAVKQTISGDVARLRQYFARLEINLPEEVPLLGVLEGRHHHTGSQMRPTACHQPLVSPCL
jgi:hypothetical protein